jgi:predicted nucleic acid-binding protein
VRTVVVDASVVVKWVFPNRRAEADIDEALALLRAIRDGGVTVVQPPHWLAEVAAVVTRLDATVAGEVVALLHAMEFPVADEPEVYRMACELGGTLGQHVFDTLYHAVALTRTEATLVTADKRYFQKARHMGGMEILREFQAG